MVLEALGLGTISFASIAKTWIFWFLIILLTFGFCIFALYLQRRRKLRTPAAELIQLGNGKMGINFVKAGKFGKQVFFKGLFSRGPLVVKNQRMEDIIGVSSEDMQMVNGRAGIVYMKDPERPGVNVSVTQLSIVNGELIAAIPKMDLTNALTNKFRETLEETTSNLEKLYAVGTYAIMFIASLVLIILIIQYVKGAQADIAQQLILGGQEGIQACKDICREAVNVAVNRGSGP